MRWPEFLLVLAITGVCNAACRILPVCYLSNKALPKKIQRALNLIPAACFAALVANDLFSPAMIQGNVTWEVLVPFAAAVPVVLVSRKSRSLIWAVVIGIGCYSALYFLA